MPFISVACKVVLLTANVFNLFILEYPHFFFGIFSQLFLSLALYIPSHQHPCIVSEWKSVGNLTIVLLYMKWSFSLLLLTFFFHSLTMIYLGMDIFGFVLLRGNIESIDQCFTSNVVFNHYIYFLSEILFDNMTIWVIQHHLQKGSLPCCTVLLLFLSSQSVNTFRWVY
jgi:hypothetical protein